MVTNVVPYTKALAAEILYEDALRIAPLPSDWHDHLKLPLMDVSNETRDSSSRVIHGRFESSLTGIDVSGVTRRCPFVEAGSTSIGWEGNVSPCLPLLHTHNEFVYGRERRVELHVLGSIATQSLAAIWGDPEYIDLRTRVQQFDFAPCLACGGCSLSDGNYEDCERDVFPRCGAFLWSHGLVQCP